jgi:hypothetical protein
MKKTKGAIACGLLLAMGLIGCSDDSGASVPAGAGADAAVGKANDQAGAPKTKKSTRPLSATD